MTDALISVAGLGKRFDGGTVAALSDLSFEIGTGAITGLVGPDGAGKTTLLRLLAGLLDRDEGAMRVCGLDPRTDAAPLHAQLSYMPQKFGLYEDLTVLENLDLYADLREVSGPERAERFETLLAFTTLGPFTGRLAGALSGGMKQKLGLACALIRKPRLLLLDEPSVGVDPISRRELWRMVQDLVDDGIGVIWSTAYLDEAELCGRVLVLSEGRMIFDGPPGGMTAPLVGRAFRLTGLETGRRRILGDLLTRADVVDGVIEGADIRLILRPGSEPGALSEGLTGARMVPVPPRFEDAFMDRLGGVGKQRSPFRNGAGAERMPGKSVIRSDRLTRKFGDFVAASEISFNVTEGEIYGLIGPNGAGKSTTFKMLCGLLKPTSGSATIAGFDLGQSPSKARGRLGYMAQKFSLYGDLSVRQNLDFFAGVYGLSGAGRATAIGQMIDTFELGELLGQDAGSVPPGHKQRLALACAVMHHPDVLFLDEPTSGVDPRTRREFWTHINALSGSGTTIIVTTHFMEEAEYCDRVGLVYAGNMIAEGSPSALKARAGDPEITLEEAFIHLVETSQNGGVAP